MLNKSGKKKKTNLTLKFNIYQANNKTKKRNQNKNILLYYEENLMRALF